MYLVRERTDIRELGLSRKNPIYRARIGRGRLKKSKTNDRCSEQCDARRSERKCCKNNIRAEEEQIPVARTEITRRRARRYRHKAGGEGNKGAKNNAVALALPPLNSAKTKQKLPLTARGSVC